MSLKSFPRASRFIIGAVMAPLLVALAGCVPFKPGYSVIRTGEARPKNLGCDFAILSLPPTYPFEEVGLIEPVERAVTQSAVEFKAVIADRVCALGGDAVVPQMNRGCYIGGAVIRRVASERSTR